MLPMFNNVSIEAELMVHQPLNCLLIGPTSPRSDMIPANVAKGTVEKIAQTI